MSLIQGDEIDHRPFIRDHPQEKKYEDARQKFTDALNTYGFRPSIAYNIALCYYNLKQYSLARKYIIEIIDKGIKEHPELGIGSSSEPGSEVRSVGNTLTLKETALVEAFNLKAAIEYEMKNCEHRDDRVWNLIDTDEAAKESLNDMPPRLEAELDPVTLHNVALMHMDDNPNEHLPKLNFLLSAPSSPPQTFANLLLVYCRFQYFEIAADVLAENSHLTYTLLDPVSRPFLFIIVNVLSPSPESLRILGCPHHAADVAGGGLP